MEVHHHSHTDRKRWSHYFWEFLMLFLAVFAGFLAENRREHYIENQRAKAYAKSLLYDLQADIEEIKTAGYWETATTMMIDSLVLFMAGPKIYEQGAKLYYLMRWAGNFYGVDWNRATMNQLISSGNLRYFTNHELVSLISAYNTGVNTINEQEDGIMAHRNRATLFRDQIFKAEFFLRATREFNLDSMTTWGAFQITDSSKSDWPVMNRDPQLLNSYANALISTKAPRRRLKTRLYPNAIAEATKIMKLLKKEYRLE